MTGNGRSPRLKPDWSTIRRLYEEGTLSVGHIAEQHGVTTSALHKRRAAQGWPKRSEAQTQKQAGVPRKHARTGTKEGRKEIVERLYNILEQNLKLMEIRMESSGPGTAADRERDTRAIGSLTRTVEKITELDADTITSASAAPNSDNASVGSGIDAAEADRIRLELAQRILKLRECRQPR